MAKWFINKVYIIEAATEQEALKKSAGKAAEKFVKEQYVEKWLEKPSINEIIQHYKTGMSDYCLVCDQELSGGYTQKLGEIACRICGTPYQRNGAQGVRPEFLEKNSVQASEIATNYCLVFEYIPLLREYWQQHHERVPFGERMDITQFEETSFFNWLSANRQRFEKTYPSFPWDKI